MPRSDKSVHVEQMLSEQRARVEQMVDAYGVPCDVQVVRTFRSGRVLGAGYDLRNLGTWFVYDADTDPTAANGLWRKHCGPYSTYEQAKDWILAIRELPVREET